VIVVDSGGGGVEMSNAGWYLNSLRKLEGEGIHISALRRSILTYLILFIAYAVYRNEGHSPL